MLPLSDMQPDRSVCRSRGICCLAVAYLQFSIFTNVQWMREHDVVHSQPSTIVTSSIISGGVDSKPMQATAETLPAPRSAKLSRDSPLQQTSAAHDREGGEPTAKPSHDSDAHDREGDEPMQHAQGLVTAELLAHGDVDGGTEGDAADSGGAIHILKEQEVADDSDGLLSDGGLASSLDAGGRDGDSVTAAGNAAGAKVSSWLESDSYGKFIGITPFFNPGRHENKVDNLRKFRASVKAQGLQMLCVELVFGGADVHYQLRDNDCEILIQRRTTSGNTLWQKERLLNIALDNLPNTVDKVMWLDSDLIFLNDDWVPETAELLDRYAVVQPFGWMTYLPASAEGKCVEYAMTKLSMLPLGQGVGAVYHSGGLGIQSFPDMCFRSNFLLGHPGFAWAARREVITAAGFYDRSIIGGGDRIMLFAFSGHYPGMTKKMPPAMVKDVRAFGRKVTPMVGPSNMSYTPGVVLHIWHGDRANRDYTNRYQILLSNHYDPAVDVDVNADGILEWKSQKLRLHKQVSEYFNNRKEGPRPNRTDADSEQDNVRTVQRDSLSRPVRSFLGYHCGKADYRAACKIAFRLWGDAIRATRLQLYQKKLREQQALPIARAGV